MSLCVPIDIVPVSSEQPIGADQEEVFEEEPSVSTMKASGLLPLHILCVPHNLHDN
jgi:hypothetical protein